MDEAAQQIRQQLGAKPGINQVEPSPPDKRLIDQLQTEVAAAEQAVEHHERELERARRIARAARAALEELQSDKPMPATREY